MKALLLFMWRKREAGYHGHGRGGAGRAGVGDTHDRSNFGAVVDRFKATFQAVWGADGFRDYLAPPPPPPRAIDVLQQLSAAERVAATAAAPPPGAPGSPGGDALGAGAKAFAVDDDVGAGDDAELARGVALGALRELLKTHPHIGYMLHQGIADMRDRATGEG